MGEEAQGILLGETPAKNMHSVREALKSRLYLEVEWWDASQIETGQSSCLGLVQPQGHW
jgi:hypothetical protein